MRILAGPAHAGLTTRAFLGTDFEGGRHGRRVDRIADIEGRGE